MTPQLNIGIIGMGRIGRVHAKHVAYQIPAARLAAVADVDVEAARAHAQPLGVSTAVQDYRVLLDDAAIDAVAICSSTDTHAQMIEEAAAAGKHIFCEKPIAFTLEEIDRALDAVDQAGVKFQVGFNRRFDPTFRRVRTAIEQGEIGEPHVLHLISRDPSPPPLDYIRRSGGLFFDMTIHDFDMGRFLTGSEVDEVYTAAAVQVDPAIGEVGDLDTAVIMLQFANGVIGTIDNSRKAVYGYDQRAEVFGSGGRVQTDNHYPNAATISNEQRVQRDLPLNFFMERYLESYRVEMQAFVEAVLDNRPVPVGGEDGRVAVVMSMAARTSYDEHRPVRLDEVEEVVHD
jgi:myo-inositol 2-dehydrogenase/D-chiro-inositol 1-dehydrogenase